jgi:hypothetical protein
VTQLYYQVEDVDPGYIPSLRVRLPRSRLEAIDALIPVIFTDRSDAIRQLTGIGLKHLAAAAAPSGQPEVSDGA